MKIVNSIEEAFKYLGIKKEDNISIMTPQFERLDEIEINYIPQTIEEFKVIMDETPKEVLLKLGLGIWEEEDNKYHFLFPHEWFDYIPEGLEIISISGKKEYFNKETSDDDKRYGMLAYGFIKEF